MMATAEEQYEMLVKTIRRIITNHFSMVSFAPAINDNEEIPPDKLRS